MEKDNSKETEDLKTTGALVILSTLTIGYIIGRLSINQVAVEAYRRGVSDTLSSIILHR